MTVTLKIADEKLARWLCSEHFLGITLSGAILVTVGGETYGWPIDPGAWKR